MSEVTVGQSDSQLRFRIDALDAAIGRALQERRAISHEIQRQRLRAGGTRLDQGREQEVIDNYVALLGPGAVDTARGVLTLCRGEVLVAYRDEPEG